MRAASRRSHRWPWACHSGSSRVIDRQQGCAAPRGRCRCGRRGDGSAQDNQATAHASHAPDHRASVVLSLGRGRCRSGSTRRPDKAARHRPARHPAQYTTVLPSAVCRSALSSVYGAVTPSARGAAADQPRNAALAAQISWTTDTRQSSQQAARQPAARPGGAYKQLTQASSYCPFSLRSSHSALVTSTARGLAPS